jgi:hypothetical protein
VYLSTPYPTYFASPCSGPAPTYALPTNLSPISLPHVTKLRYCRGLLAGSRAEVVGAMEIQRRPVSIETINKGVYLDHWVVTGRPLRFAIVRRGLRPGHAIILWTLRIPQGVFASISTLSFVFHVRVRFCAGGVPPSFHPTYPIPNRTTRHPSRPNTRIHGQRVFDRFTGANGKAQVIERIEVIGEDTTIAPVRRPAHPSGHSRL